MPHLHVHIHCTCTIFSIDTELLFHVNECPCEALFTEDEDGKIKLCDDNGNIQHIMYMYTNAQCIVQCTLYSALCICKHHYAGFVQHILTVCMYLYQ